MAQKQGQILNAKLIEDYLGRHGFEIVDRGDMDFLQIAPEKSMAQLVFRENISNIPSATIFEEYDKLEDYVNQAPPIHQKQLKPLLFAFFFNVVIYLKKSRKTGPDDLAEFFDHHVKPARPENAFHPIHSNDLKRLQEELSQTLRRPNFQSFQEFHAYMTENTYQALITFLIDNSFFLFSYILSNYIKVTFVPINFFSNRTETNFLFHSVNQSADSEAFTSLLSGSAIDLAKKYLGDKCNFEIVDDDPSTPHKMNPVDYIPPVYTDRVMTTASDMLNMKHLSKNSLPSCAYFTFHNENISYDINYNGTLIAVSTPYGYTQLFATSVYTDLDFSAIPTGRKTNDLVPPCNFESRKINRILFGPRTYCCRFSPESRFLLCSGVSSVRIWQLEQASGFSEISMCSSIIWCADWSPYGYHFVCGDDNKLIWLMSVDRETPLRLFLGHQDAITNVKYHENSVTIASASHDGSVMLWDVRASNGKSSCTRVFADGDNAIPLSIAFSRNGRVIVTGDENGTITTWDIGESRKYGSVSGRKGQIRDMAISQEGTILATAGAGGEVSLWDMSTLSSNTASNAKPLKKFTPKHSYTNRLSFSSRNLLHAIGSIKI